MRGAGPAIKTAVPIFDVHRIDPAAWLEAHFADGDTIFLDIGTFSTDSPISDL